MFCATITYNDTVFGIWSEAWSKQYGPVGFPLDGYVTPRRTSYAESDQHPLTSDERRANENSVFSVAEKLEKKRHSFRLSLEADYRTQALWIMVSSFQLWHQKFQHSS